MSVLKLSCFDLLGADPIKTGQGFSFFAVEAYSYVIIIYSAALVNCSSERLSFVKIYLPQLNLKT